MVRSYLHLHLCLERWRERTDSSEGRRPVGQSHSTLMVSRATCIRGWPRVSMHWGGWRLASSRGYDMNHAILFFFCRTLIEQGHQLFSPQSWYSEEGDSLRRIISCLWSLLLAGGGVQQTAVKLGLLCIWNRVWVDIYRERIIFIITAQYDLYPNLLYQPWVPSLSCNDLF